MPWLYRGIVKVFQDDGPNRFVSFCFHSTVPLFEDFCSTASILPFAFFLQKNHGLETGFVDKALLRSLNLRTLGFHSAL